MKPFLAVSQRVDINAEHGERRDALDQRWSAFLHQCGYLPLLLPNHFASASEIVSRLRPTGLLLTGGNSLVDQGGNAPERDKIEMGLIDLMLNMRLPVLGVCRGMQVIQSIHGETLEKVDGHVTKKQTVHLSNGTKRFVCSYHDIGSTNCIPPLKAWAHSDDGVVKAICHSHEPLLMGIMWHPERMEPIQNADVELLQQHFEQGINSK